MDCYADSILLHRVDAGINETISALKDLTLNIVLPEEIVLAVTSANSLSSHTA